MKVEMEIELLQPWSTFVMKAQLPPWVLEKMIRITDEIVEDRAGKGDDPGAGQMEDQFYIDLKILEQEEIQEYFSGVCTHYVTLAFDQSNPGVIQEELHAWPTNMWRNSQKDNEYFEMHEHVNCAFSSVMYLKIPEYLPDRKSYNISVDGAIEFMDNKGRDTIWARSMFYIQPQVGDFLIFPMNLL